MSSAISSHHTVTDNTIYSYYSPYWRGESPAPPSPPITQTPPTQPMFDLQEVLAQYQSQPELLKLILSSKVEEDKRRAEEAKLRAKELDWFLKGNASVPLKQTDNSATDYRRTHRGSTSRAFTSIAAASAAPYPPPSSSSRAKSQPGDYYDRRTSVTANKAETTHRSPSASPSYIPASPSQSSLPAFGAYAFPSTTASSQESSSISSSLPSLSSPSSPGSPASDNGSSTMDSAGPQRRRREMQAITKIVETREFPYHDNYFWKNNGNTTQRKTGLKSIYYKCSNSNRGCPVNKTVTERPNGEFLIKYRGEHLPECGRVERVCEL